MRRKLKIAWITAVWSLTVLTAPGIAQLYHLDIIYGGVADAEKILKEYLRPYSHILGSELNAGWYHTARPHELGGLDVTAVVSWAKAPPGALVFDVSALGLEDKIDPAAPEMAPTIAGRMEERPTLSYSMEGKEYARFTLPDGTGKDLFPLPMIQLSVGLPFGTDVSARFIPQVGYRNYGEIGVWGVGGKHSVSQWLPFIDRLDFLDISLQGGYTRVTSSIHVSVEPLASVEVDPQPDYNWDDQFVTQWVSGWTTNLIASQTVSVLTFYQGIGYAGSLVELSMEGHYPVHRLIPEGDQAGMTTYDILRDPIDLTYQNFQKVRLNGGVRLKLGVLTLHYDFTHTRSATHTAGVGISFR